MEIAQNWFLNESPSQFCVNDRILPSIFVIGIQKCGTSTLDGILSTYPQLSHGTTKEHHFFDHDNLDFDKYIKQFPKCSKNIVRSYDATPKYTNPNTNSADNIKTFYNKLGIPLNKLIFIAIVCPNYLRVPSNFYFSRWNGYLKSNKTRLNNWFDWTLKHQDQDESFLLLRKGFYDEILAKYFDLFPDSTFLLIDNQHAFKQMQTLNNFLAAELNFPTKQIPDIHKNKGKGSKEEELTEFNLKKLNQLYSNHERDFFEIARLNKNVKTFPRNNFLDQWNLGI